MNYTYLSGYIFYSLNCEEISLGFNMIQWNWTQPVSFLSINISDIFRALVKLNQQLSGRFLRWYFFYTPITATTSTNAIITPFITITIITITTKTGLL